MHLSTLEHGAYLLLLFHYWRRGGPLPREPEQLRRFAGVSRTVWKKISPILSEFFRDDGTHWIHDRVEAELERARVKCLKAQAAGQQSGASRRQRSLNGRSSQVEPPTNSPHLHLQHPPYPPSVPPAQTAAEVGASRRRPPSGVQFVSTPDPLDLDDERRRQREDLEAHLRKLQENGSADASDAGPGMSADSLSREAPVTEPASDASAVSEVPASVLPVRCSTCDVFDCDEHVERAESFRG